MKRLFRRVKTLLRWRQREQDLQDELTAHVAMDAQERIEAGDPPDTARQAAWRDFGNVARVTEDTRAAWGWAGVEQFVQDLRYAFRQLRRSPGFVAVVVATLALGIGGTTAVFSVVEAVLLAPLPYEASGQLVRFYQEEPDVASSRTDVTAPHFKEIRDQATSFEDVAAFNERNGGDLIAHGQAQRLRVLQVTSGYFRTLRSGPLRGRGFERADEVGAPRMILSDALWRTRFDGNPSIIGATVHLSAEPYVVVGIAPHGFEDPIVGQVDAWLPYNLAGNTSEENYTLDAVGRLRNGVSLEQARAEIAALTQSLAEQWPGVRASTLVVRPLKEDLVAPSRGTLHVLLIAVGLVLLVACANVANLFLVRATGRTRELAIRVALGSGGARIARQLLLESLLLAAAGGLLGLALSAWGVHTLRTLGHDAIPRLAEVGFDPMVLAFATLVTLGSAVGVGVMAAIRFARIDPSRALGAHSRSATSTRRHARLRSALAAAQLALALTLLSAAALLMVSFHGLQRMDLGFRIERVLTFDLSLPSARYDAKRRAAFYEEFARRLERIPGVTRAGGTHHLPATGTRHAWPVRVDGGPLAGTVPKIRTGGTDQQAEQRTVSGDFFAALDIPVLAGRTFGAEDSTNAPPRAVVSADFARQAFPGMSLDNVVGQQIAIFSQENSIIGVVGDVALDAHGAPGATVYRAHRQNADDMNANWTLTQVVATDVLPERILASVRAEVAALDPELVVHRAAPMTEIVGRGVSRERFALVLMGAFAAVALGLAALGLYGVLAYTVRQRTQEIGIRMALGATAAQVRVLVLRQAALVLAIGLVVGIAGAMVLGRGLSSLVFEISPSDPRILLAAAVLLTITGLLAAWLPARRASRVAPRIAMQEGY
ncbi:MAG: FtsX-like permease family protein [Luteitalea sp.]|nr:FtsX-like permease family protein [Luteitalea sp.]